MIIELVMLIIWCCVPARVKRNNLQKRHELEALVRTLMNTWANDDLNEQIKKVLDFLKKVLVLILQADGGNNIVEA